MRNKILIFDGICAMCNSFVLFVLRKDRKEQIKFISLQSQKAKQILFDYGVVYDINNLDTIYYVKEDKIFNYSDAIFELIIDINYYKQVAMVSKFIPKIIRDSIYKFIARNRYVFFGKTDSCQLLSDKERDRIIE